MAEMLLHPLGAINRRGLPRPVAACDAGVIRFMLPVPGAT
jgi:hypothetical protein